MFRRTSLIAAASVALVSTPSFAQSAADVRCLILSYEFIRAGKTDAMKKTAQLAGIFYLGKIDGRYSDAQLRSALAQQQKTLVGPRSGADMQACVTRMQESERRLGAAARQPTQTK